MIYILWTFRGWCLLSSLWEDKKLFLPIWCSQTGQGIGLGVLAGAIVCVGMCVSKVCQYNYLRLAECVMRNSNHNSKCNELFVLFQTSALLTTLTQSQANTTTPGYLQDHLDRVSLLEVICQYRREKTQSNLVNIYKSLYHSQPCIESDWTTGVTINVCLFTFLSSTVCPVCTLPP